MSRGRLADRLHCPGPVSFGSVETRVEEVSAATGWHRLPGAVDELAQRERHRDARCAIARDLFYKAGTATARAMALVYDLLELPVPGPTEPRRTAEVPESPAPSMVLPPERAHQAYELHSTGPDA